MPAAEVLTVTPVPNRVIIAVTRWRRRWDCAARLDGVDAERRLGFTEDAIATLQRAHPGEIETTGRNHVLFAIA